MTGPALKGTPLDEIALHGAISRGISGTRMPAFAAEEGGSMQKHEIDDLVIFIKNWQRAQPKLTLPSTTIPSEQGKVIFEQKCAACHSIGGGRLVGPDLKSITNKRDMDWLIRIIVSPEELIAQGDPLAKQLLEEYGVPMPNVGISEEEGLIDAPIGRDPTCPSRMTIHPQGREAQSEFRVLARNKETTLLLVSPYTGRTHQIRIHLHYIGHPIVGDPLFSQGDKRLMLHAWRVELIHPERKERIRFEAAVPPEFPEYPYREISWPEARHADSQVQQGN